jgi:hypothetical protein
VNKVFSTVAPAEGEGLRERSSRPGNHAIVPRGHRGSGYSACVVGLVLGRLLTWIAAGIGLTIGRGRIFIFAVFIRNGRLRARIPSLGIRRGPRVGVDAVGKAGINSAGDDDGRGSAEVGL